MNLQLSPGLPIIELQGIGVSRGGQRILDNMDLTVCCGERVALIGPSGSGKSTILRCINGLSRPDAGSLRLFGLPIVNAATLREARLRMDTIFQSFNLYSHLTVLENVMLAPQRLLARPSSTARSSAESHLAQLGVGHLAARYPHELSGGQAQRVALARALAKGPDILLLDEPTSALDPENVKGALEAITRATERGITTLSVTHELGFARKHAHRVLFIDGGRIVEAGTPDEIFVAPRSDRLKRFLRAAH